MTKRKNANEIQLDVTDCSIEGAVFLRISHQEYKKTEIFFSAHLCNSEGSTYAIERRRYHEKVQARANVV